MLIYESFCSSRKFRLFNQDNNFHGERQGVREFAGEKLRYKLRDFLKSLSLLHNEEEMISQTTLLEHFTSELTLRKA